MFNVYVMSLFLSANSYISFFCADICDIKNFSLMPLKSILLNQSLCGGCFQKVDCYVCALDFCKITHHSNREVLHNPSSNSDSSDTKIYNLPNLPSNWIDTNWTVTHDQLICMHKSININEMMMKENNGWYPTDGCLCIKIIFYLWVYHTYGW